MYLFSFYSMPFHALEALTKLQTKQNRKMGIINHPLFEKKSSISINCLNHYNVTGPSKKSKTTLRENFCLEKVNTVHKDLLVTFFSSPKT